jgi:tRNA threonylcarbamoyladenosine biosynthesis protein TsaB
MNRANRHSIQLALETIGRQGSLAVTRGDLVLHSINLSSAARTAATLAPEVDRTLRWCRQTGSMPEFLSVAVGPGSFTGLRIGVTTAKSLSYALRLPLVSIDSLASIAAAAVAQTPEAASIVVALNAYRGQVYVGSFERSALLPDLDAIPEGWSGHPEGVSVLTDSQWNQARQRLSADTAVAGDVKPLGDRASTALPRTCDAIGTALLGIRAAIAGQWIDPLQLVPKYLKPSAAEENQ